MGPSSFGPNKAYPGLSNLIVSVLNQLALRTDILVILGFVAIVISWLLSRRPHVAVITKKFISIFMTHNFASPILRIRRENLYGIMLFPLNSMLNFKGNYFIQISPKFFEFVKQSGRVESQSQNCFNSGFLEQL